MYLIDTNVILELRNVKPHGGVVAWMQSVRDTDLFISARSPKRKTPRRPAK